MENQFAAIVGPERAAHPLVLGIVLYPFMTALDFVGPLTVLSMACTTHLLSKTLDPVPTDTGFSVVPTTTFAECPEHLDILLVPGGFGSNSAMEDKEVLDFLRKRGANTGYVTSVSSGSTVLGAAGLLDGYKAATHWASYSTLEAMEIETGRERVVSDQNRISGGGVTAGIDFGLVLLAKFCGEDAAKRVQLIMEYDPQPPFKSGHPRTADAKVTQEVTAWLKPITDQSAAIGQASLRTRALPRPLLNEESLMSPLRIVTVPILPRGMVNSFIIVGERPVVVDSGVPGSAPKILAALAREGFAPSDASLILITHRHVDHIGSAAALKRATGAPVAVHALDAEWLSQGDGGPRPPTGWPGRLFDLTGFPGQRAEPCEPDLVIESDFALERYGVPGGVVLHTPGHTSGSVSALLPNGDVLAGDLVIGGVLIGGIVRLRHARKPPFEDDPITVRQSLIQLLDRGASRFYVGHGGPLTAAAVRKYIAREPRLAASGTASTSAA